MGSGYVVCCWRVDYDFEFLELILSRLHINGSDVAFSVIWLRIEQGRLWRGRQFAESRVHNCCAIRVIPSWAQANELFVATDGIRSVIGMRYTPSRDNLGEIEQIRTLSYPAVN